MQFSKAVLLKVLMIAIPLVLLSACSPLDQQLSQNTGQPPVESTQLPTLPAATDQPSQTQPANLPAQFKPATDKLAQQLGVADGKIALASYQDAEWPDSCLGAANANEMCAQVITPGYVAFFTTPQGIYEVHTNLSGSDFRIIGTSSTGTPQTQPILTWERSGGFAGICQRLVVNSDASYTLADCRGKAEPVTGSLTSGQFKALNAYLQQYGEFQWESSAPQGSADMFMDKYTLFGSGNQIPSADQQAAINDLIANLVSQLNTAGNPGQVSGTSGIQGQVTIGPACPGPVTANSPCPDKPYQTELAVTNEKNQPVTQLQTDDLGQFKLALPPGTYTISTVLPNGYPRGSSQTVTVQAGTYTTVNITLDSGIR